MVGLSTANANHNSVANLATFVRLFAQKVTRLRSLIDGFCYMRPQLTP